MLQGKIHIIAARIRPLSALLIGLALVASLYLPIRAQRSSPQQPEARPRRVEPGQKGTTPTPSPAKQQPTPTKSQSGDTSDPPPPALKSAPPDEQNPAGQEIDPDEVVRVDTNLVNLHVRVVDRANRPVNDVRQDEFRVFEDGVPQTIAFFTKEEVPISYGLVIDNSASLRGQIDKVIEAGKTIINSNKPGDETFLVRFVSSDQIETVRDFTSDKNALMDAMDELYVEGGQTAIIDAVYLSAERVARYKKGDPLNDRRRRALILVTDGEDRASYYKQDELFAHLREDDVQIFVIGFVNELENDRGLIRKSKREQAVNLLNRLAQDTGGRAFFPQSLSELPNIANEITRDLRTQYVIGYAPTNKARDGSYRSVRVTVASAGGRDKRIAITRPGYTAPRDGGPVTPRPATTRSNDTTPARPALNGQKSP